MLEQIILHLFCYSLDIGDRPRMDGVQMANIATVLVSGIKRVGFGWGNRQIEPAWEQLEDNRSVPA